mmetsp:Transcript_46640/g.77138  ORF Transcript_46640/g.77138 Transcript_46640/m.77138 type:complete len:639 (+) Transcript_46640:118-2034(+)|eukprot:CAMPEP_0119335886 /NCGR_PEP_ID=MMETSP1333-20130426/90581_1 /TAXON_ID=418940 /ORGANISM="Scyphosphaera apsteinii, Strain RCC1455" /LENGTH=638 /DNA_ID=CAMNT_0007346555 /DNA_START=96 /DNA_END=2012 /DNA_ORIENTATION=-
MKRGFSCCEPNDYELQLSQTDNPPSAPAAAARHPVKGKTIQDRIYGSINIDGLLVAVMDTPEFQRLDTIKQLGGCSYVYPSAVHTRKEHSIGVSHLAGEMLKCLRQRDVQEDGGSLGISNDDITCVELAGLVHDLGHGPFSHMFEDFMTLRGQEVDGVSVKWKHEHMSGRMLDAIILNHDIPLELYFENGELWREHLEFVKRLIGGLDETDQWPDGIGRGEEKRFLFDIVSNKRNGIDVDKLDYIMRDDRSCNTKQASFEVSRLIEAAKVLPTRGQQQICFEMKVGLDINRIYWARSSLHQTVYQHHTANAAELMITDLLLEADRAGFEFRGENGEPTGLWQAAFSPGSFAQLNDSVLDAIRMSVQPGLDTARELLRRLKAREFYRQIGPAVTLPTLPRCSKCKNETKIADKFCNECGKSTSKRQGKNVNNVLVPFLAIESAEAIKDELIEIAQAIKDDLINDEQIKATSLEQMKVELAQRLRQELAVHLVDIQHGRKCEREDAFGRVWRDWDPYWGVGFFNPKDPQPMVKSLSMKRVANLFVPSIVHQRTLYCYLRTDEDALAFVATEALKRFCDDNGLGENLGHANARTPNSSAATPLSQPRARIDENGNEPRKAPRSLMSSIQEALHESNHVSPQ